jgi:hypothetical protein
MLLCHHVRYNVDQKYDTWIGCKVTLIEENRRNMLRRAVEEDEAQLMNDF